MIIMSAFAISILLIILLILIAKNMENSKTTAKDFFLHLGAIVGLYTVTVSLINLVFKIISKAFPEINSNAYAWGAGSQISMPVATLIVFFPIFIVLSRMVHKIYIQDPTKKDLPIRKWLTYITLFVAGAILAGDLVTVIYKFLDGQDLTLAFILKALTILIVSGAIFWFYIQDIREKISSNQRKIWSIIVGIIILISIIVGFSVVGSPQAQRLIRYDNQKIEDLRNIQWQVISYWQMNGRLPASLEEILGSDQQQGLIVPKDPQLNISYEYRQTDTMNFELCAEFNKEDLTKNLYSGDRTMPIETKGIIIQNDNWNHGTGRQCFTRVIDPVQFPTQVRG